MTKKAIVMEAADNVATAVENIEPLTEMILDVAGNSITVQVNLRFGIFPGAIQSSNTASPSGLPRATLKPGNTCMCTIWKADGDGVTKIPNPHNL